jgi:hypothetical protein
MKPVAWMLADKEAEHIRSIMAVQHDFVPEGCVEIPLYTHPVKELTDEEINKLWAESHEDGIAMQQGFTTQQHYFAHLILRKAQENG